MTEGWAFTGGPPTTPSMSTVSLVEGRCFCVSEPSGDIGAAGGHGLVVKDTRFLDHLELHVDGEPLESLTVEHTGPHAATFVTRRRPRPGLADSTLLVVRRRYVGNGMVEDVTLENLSAGAVTVTLTLTASTDFAGLFDVKEGRLVKRRDAIEVTTDDTTLRRRIDRADSRAVEISATGEYQVFRHGLIWHLTVPARGATEFTLRVVPVFREVPLRSPYRRGVSRRESHPAREHRRWRERSPVVSSADPRLHRLVRNGTEDLSGLRITDPRHPRRVVLAAGAPWFMTVFGRDSLLTELDAAPPRRPGRPGHARRCSPSARARWSSPATEEEPGRILHEIRSGLPAAADAGRRHRLLRHASTPRRCSSCSWASCAGGAPRGRRSNRCCPTSTRALDWVSDYGDRDGDGFVEYERATPHGLVNQGWKDSFDGDHLRLGRARRTHRSRLPRCRATSTPRCARGPSWPRRSATTSAPGELAGSRPTR